MDSLGSAMPDKGVRGTSEESIRYGLSNARIEATNNKIKLVIRMAYGFRNTKNMLDMVMLKCGCYKVSLPWEKEKTAA